jgi:hypothetical protein
MIYALIIDEYPGSKNKTYVHVDGSKESPKLTAEDHYLYCVEHYLNEHCEGESTFPSGDRPWILVAAETLEEIKNGHYFIFKVLSTDTQETLWDFHEFVYKNRCVSLRIKMDY